MSGVAPTTPPELLGSRRSRLLGRLRPGGVFVAVVEHGRRFRRDRATSSSPRPAGRASSNRSSTPRSSGRRSRSSFGRLWKNIQLFLMAEVCILVFALLLAVMRSLPGPVFFPFRLMSVVYIDIFRAVPGILVIFVLGFGIPGLRLPGVPTDPFIWGLVALVIVWSAYVAEVYRAGIECVHPSQEAAARSLGLSRSAGPALRRPAAGGPARDPAAAERLHRPPEGHRARVVHRRDRGIPPNADRGRRLVQFHALHRRARCSSCC